MEKRDRVYTINLTQTEAEKIEKLAQKERRKAREFIYLLISDLIANK
jgi:hypothetical protein